MTMMLSAESQNPEVSMTSNPLEPSNVWQRESKAVILGDLLGDSLSLEL